MLSAFGVALPGLQWLVGYERHAAASLAQAAHRLRRARDGPLVQVDRAVQIKDVALEASHLSFCSWIEPTTRVYSTWTVNDA